ncbi:MAG: hypothetical protein Q4D51_13585 [Eubacteriales bacterium]|nr:hypothetical protein [Eubacteriales bacterium]
MKKVGVKERAVLFKNRRMCLETSFRQKEKTTLWQWVIIMICGIATFVRMAEWIVTVIMQDLKIKSRAVSDIFGTSFVLLCVCIVCGTLYFIFRAYNYRKAWYDFLLLRHLEINTAIVKKVENKCVTYMENGRVDADGKPYLIDYQVKVSGLFVRKPKVADSILVLHGEDKRHNEVTRIAMVNDELRKYVTEVKDVAKWEALNRYPHDMALKLRREAWVPTQEQANDLLEKELKNQKKIQLDLVIKASVGYMLAFGALAFCVWADSERDVGKLVLYIAIAELIAVVFSVVSRKGGVENIQRTTPNKVKNIQEVLYLNSVISMNRSVELCVWDEKKQDYVQRVYPICNMFLKEKKIGTVYYMLTGIVGEHLLVEKEHIEIED